jgi:hypothetical protein
MLLLTCNTMRIPMCLRRLFNYPMVHTLHVLTIENVTDAGPAAAPLAPFPGADELHLLPGVEEGDAPASELSCSTSTLIRTIRWLLLLRALARVSPTALLALAMVTSAAASSMLPQGCGHDKSRVGHTKLGRSTHDRGNATYKGHMCVVVVWLTHALWSGPG